jgi:hypothetical protein
MTNPNPIEDQVRQDMSPDQSGSTNGMGSNPYTDKRQARIPVDEKMRVLPGHGDHERTRKVTVGDDYMSDLIDGQQRLIAAHHQFLHDHNVEALAAAQRDFLGIQTDLLARLGVFG